MVVWTEIAIHHITEFIDEPREGTRETVKYYMERLIDYVDILETMPKMGKKIEEIIYSNYELRQIIYKSHRIIYHIKDNIPVIIAVLHVKLDIKKALSRIKKYMK